LSGVLASKKRKAGDANYMFESSLFEQPSPIEQPVVNEAQSGGLFNDYELKGWQLGPRIYKIIGISALANILALLVFAQTSILTMKGCDSPLVGNVCRVLDTVYVGTLLFGTDRQMVDQDYEKTELADADITYVDLTNVDTSKLEYPEGYFQIANPEQFTVDPATGELAATKPGEIAPGIPIGVPQTAPATSGSTLFDTKPNIPKKNRNVIDESKLPNGIDDATAGGSNPIAKNTKGRKGVPEGGIKPNDPTSDDPTNNGTVGQNPASTPKPSPAADEPTQDRFGVYLNKRPTREFAEQALKQIDAKQVDLNTPFKITMKGTLGLGKDGKTTILKEPRLVLENGQTAGDPKMLKFAQDAIIAFTDSGWFGYLSALSSKNVVIMLEQSDSGVVARITADQPDENSANMAANGLRGLLTGAQSFAVDNDEKIFLQAAQPGADKKTFFVNFQLPKQIFTEMIQRKLAEQKASPKPSPGQPDGSTTTGKLANNTARK